MIWRWARRAVQWLGAGVLVLFLILLVISAAHKLANYYIDKDADDKWHLKQGVHADIRFGGQVFHCGSVVAIDAGRHHDAPMNFYDNTNGSLIMQCGGACWGVQYREPAPKLCTACPPPEWTCGADFP